MIMSLGDFITQARSRISETTADEVGLLLENHEAVLLIDVREPDEYAKGHIPGALLVPRGILEEAADPNSKRRVPPLCAATDQAVVLYCESGGRSALAAEVLQQMGFTQVQSLAGGCVLWEAEGFPLIGGDS
ncbi:MAG TPA: rhodanese-like domain-containing protein [Acidiferrobacter sp.]|nr:rhodanese-like domain-containing protein [Acidiferrobacter sp.]